MMSGNAMAGRCGWLALIGVILAGGCAWYPDYREAHERMSEAENRGTAYRFPKRAGPRKFLMLSPDFPVERVTGEVPAAAAAEPLPDDVSVYIREAARHNAGLRAAFDRWRRALKRVPQVTALPDPMVSYGYFIENIETRVGPQRHRVTVQQRFPWYRKLDLKGRMALAAAAAAEHELDAERRRVVYQVTAAYYDYAYLAAAVHITDENLKLLKNVEAVARTLLEADKVPQHNVIAVQVELGRLEDRLRTLTDRRRAVVADLNAWMNRPADAPLAWPRPMAQTGKGTGSPDVKGPGPFSVGEAAMVERFRSRNPTLLALDERTAEAEAAVSLARAQYVPDIAIGVTWIETGTGPLTNFADNGQDAWMVGATINLPIWHQKLRAGVRGAEAARDAARARRREMENRLRARLEAALFKLRDADRQVTLYRDSLTPKAEQALKAAQTGFAAGKVAFQNLIDSERLLLAFQLIHARALADRGKAAAEVAMIAPTEEPK